MRTLQAEPTRRATANPGRHVKPASTRLASTRRLVPVVGVLAALALVASVVAPSWLTGGSVGAADKAQAFDAAASLVSMLNSARAANGLAPLSVASDLTAVASERAHIMARSGSLSHTPDLGGRLCCWSWLGENAAYGGSVRTLHSVLMGSAPHRANILYADADDVGVAVVSSGGNLWAAQVFRARSDSGDRSSGASRSGERSSPSTSTTTPVSPDGSVTTTTTTEPTLSPAELARIELKNSLRKERERRQAAKKQNGPFDPVRSAVRYADTLGRVSR